jgi:hypothetical protein
MLDHLTKTGETQVRTEETTILGRPTRIGVPTEIGMPALVTQITTTKEGKTTLGSGDHLHLPHAFFAIAGITQRANVHPNQPYTH